MRPLDRLVKQTIKRVEAFGGDDFTFRGSHIVGIINHQLNDSDKLRFEEGSIAGSVVRIEVRASEITGRRPEVGEYLYQGSDAYEIVEVFAITKKQTYYLYCSWFPNE
jgi:hypothetical protein